MAVETDGVSHSPTSPTGSHLLSQEGFSCYLLMPPSPAQFFGTCFWRLSKMLDMQIKEPPVQSGDHEPVFDINDSERIND